MDPRQRLEVAQLDARKVRSVRIRLRDLAQPVSICLLIELHRSPEHSYHARVAKGTAGYNFATKAKLALAGGFTALTVALTSCGGGGATKPASSRAVLTDAYYSAMAAHSADLVGNITVRAATGAATNIRMSGVEQWKPLLGALSETITSRSASMTLSARLVGTDLYIELPSQYQDELGGKPWLEASLNDLVGKSGLNEYDPSQELRLLSTYADSITPVGTETVDGAATTHYRAVLDMAKSGSSPLLRQMLPELEAILGTNKLPVDVWIDSSGKLVQMRMQMLLKNAPKGASSAGIAIFPITETITLTLSHYGVPVSVSAPPPSQVSPVNLAQILQGASF